MKQLPKITILTASYNAAATIEQTIVSVVYQDYPNLEYIIIDGGSTDGTIDILKKYEKDGLRWISEPDRGLYDALNKGVGMASGEYIEVLGGDDALVDQNIISRIVHQIELNTDILCGQAWCVDEKSSMQFPYFNEIARNKETYQGGMVPHAAMFARKELLLQHPFDINYRIAADYKFFLQCYYDEMVRIQYSDEMVAFFSIAGISSDMQACYKEDNRIYEELGLPFHSPNDMLTRPIKRRMKKALAAVGLFPIAKCLWIPVRRFLNTHIRWQKHQCTNPICRWCGRIE